MSRVIVLCFLASALLGCNAVSNRLQPALAPAANVGGSLLCQQECKTEWGRAQVWLANHARMKIQLVTEVLLQTYNPISHNPYYGFSVTKEPAGSDRAVIRLALSCGNMYGCDPKAEDVDKAFFYYIKTGTDLLIGQGFLSAIR